MKRTNPALKLSKTPLVLVLCEARFATISNMAVYVPRIQDRIRREGFPIYRKGEESEHSIQADGPPVSRTWPFWDFRSKDDRWSIVLSEQKVVLQTAVYTNFEDFLNWLLLATDTVSEVVENLVVERIGLRYVDLIRPKPGESWRQYITSGFHGLQPSVAPDEKTVLFAQSVTETSSMSRLVVRLVQNRRGAVLPPELVVHAPPIPLCKETPPAKGELLTHMDLDHFHEERRDYCREGVDTIAWDLHDELDKFFRATVTPYALEMWQ